MKTTIYNLIILDESGSMGCIRKETITGCNEILNTIKAAQKEYAENQTHFVSIFTFQSGSYPSRYLIKNESPEEVNHITEEEYMPCGCTPLFDAIGITVNALRNRVNKQERAIGSVTIITDGMENSSKEYSRQQVASLIEELKKEGWNFSFIGANIDVDAVSRSMNIDNAMAFEQSSEGTHVMFDKENSCRQNWLGRICNTMLNMSQEMMDDDDAFRTAMKKTSEDYFEKN